MNFGEIKLKYLTTLLQRGDAPDYVDTDQGIQVVNQACVWPSNIDYSKIKFHDPSNTAKISGWLNLNDVLINSTGTGTLGRVGFIDSLPKNYTLFADGHVTIIRTNRKRLSPKYLFYYLSTRQNEITIECAVGATNQIELNRSAIGDKKVPLPPLGIQTKIASWLDKETLRIDALVEAKQKLLTLLAEKRRALISHAVTKGLNPKVKLKDSGISWLGMIPEHWRVERAKWIIHKIEQGWSPQCDNVQADEDEWGVIKVGSVNLSEFNPFQNKRLSEELTPKPEYEIASGDILISRANTKELLGSAVLVKQVRSKLILCDKVYRLQISPSRIIDEYMVTFLRSIFGRYQMEKEATGASSSMQNIPQEVVKNLLLPHPPLDEQKAIVDFLQKEQEKISILEEVTQRSIDLIQERRSALITAAVTGELEEAWV